MRTNREAAGILSRIKSADDLHAILPLLGFGGAAVSLDSDTLKGLGIQNAVDAGAIAHGSGALRALTVTLTANAPPHTLAERIADRLAQGSPHILWLLLAIHPQSRTLTIAAWSQRSSRAKYRTAALLVQLDHVVDSDAETLRAMAAIQDSVDLAVHTRWVEILGRDAITSRFYSALEKCVSGMAAGMLRVRGEQSRNEIALLHTSRLLFLSFLEAKGWLNGDRAFLNTTFDRCSSTGGGFEARVLRPLVFGTLNTPVRQREGAARAFGNIPFLNGGLFARSAVEKLNSKSVIPDECYGSLFENLLSRYRFTAREDSSTWSEAAVDPEMLGRAFESLMLPRARKASGAFYTPGSLVAHLTDAALRATCNSHAGASEAEMELALAGAEVSGPARGALRQCAERVRVLDPACGSGAFLVHTLERLTSLLLQLGDRRPTDEVRRSVLVNSIFGVDINPMAVWLCELRLWLAVVVDTETDDPMLVQPLPNLDHNIRVGDALARRPLSPATTARAGSRIATLRNRYVRATGRRKALAARLLAAEERKAVILQLNGELQSVTARRRDILTAARSRDLWGDRSGTDGAAPHLHDLRRLARQLRTEITGVTRGGALPFSFATHFADAAASGGFDIVIGNPPWVRTERIPEQLRQRLKREYEAFTLAPWVPDSAVGRTGTHFAAQVDLASLFVEQGLSLLRERGTVAFVLPAKLWRTLAGSSLRELLLRDSEVRALEDWSEAAPIFDAAVYPAVLVASRRVGTNHTGSSPAPEQQSGRQPLVSAAVMKGDTQLRWSLPVADIPFKSENGAPWLLVPQEVRRAFDAVAAAGEAMGRSPIGTPRLGVKCGCNSAFIVRQGALRSRVTSISSGAVFGEVEDELLRPLLRGENVLPWKSRPTSEAIIWTHGDDQRPLRALPTRARRWFAQWRNDLMHRSDLRGESRWWGLFRTEGARSDCWRVVWPDIALAPRATVLHPGDRTVPLNSCYVTPVPERDDALALAALLNSPMSAAWLNVLAEQARGGYRRYMAWTVSLLPVPHDWGAAREILAPIAERALQGAPPSDAELLHATLAAFGLAHETVAPLLTWNG